MGKKSKATDSASTGGRTTRRRRSFLRRSLSRLLVMGAVSAAVRYLVDSGKADAGRKKVMGLVGK
jgi:hypothetical protein